MSCRTRPRPAWGAQTRNFRASRPRVRFPPRRLGLGQPRPMCIQAAGLTLSPQYIYTVAVLGKKGNVSWLPDGRWMYLSRNDRSPEPRGITRTSQFVTPSLTSDGNAGRNIVEGPGLANLDAVLARVFSDQRVVAPRLSLRHVQRSEPYELSGSGQRIRHADVRCDHCGAAGTEPAVRFETILLIWLSP